MSGANNYIDERILRQAPPGAYKHYPAVNAEGRTLYPSERWRAYNQIYQDDLRKFQPEQAPLLKMLHSFSSSAADQMMKSKDK